MNDLEKLKRHVGKPIPISLKNSDGVEDIFYFKALNIEQQAILMEISKNMNSREKTVVDGKKVPSVNKEDMTEMFELILDICKSSFKDADEETLVEFANNNFDQIFNNIDKLIPNRSKEEMNIIKKRKELANEKDSE